MENRLNSVVEDFSPPSTDIIQKMSLVEDKTEEDDTRAIAEKYRILIGVKTAATGKWLQANAPTLEDWRGTVHEIYIMERLTFTLQLIRNI